MNKAARNDPVDWEVAERVALSALKLARPSPEFDATELGQQFDELTARAEQLARTATGLCPTSRARALVTDRASWVQANIGSFARLLRPIGARLAKGSPAQRRALSPANKMLAGAEIGLVLSWMSSRVLGQYDLFPGEDAGDAVYYVAPNIIGLERRHGFAPHEFRLWIAVHEVTHHLQFSGVAWMREYFLQLVERGTEISLPDAKSILSALKNAVGEMRLGRNPLEEGGVLSLLAGSDQLATLREAQALMSLLEGHADVVMAKVGTDEIPGATRFAKVLSERRSSAKGAAKLVQQALGIDAKLRQYAEGERFVEHVIEQGGDELFSRVWSAQEMLPTIEEIKDPSTWIGRASPHTARV